MRYLYFFIGFLATAGSLEAQIYIKPRPVGITADGCTNTIVAEAHNLQPGYTIGTDFGGNDVFDGDTLTDFCVYAQPAYSAELFVTVSFFPGYDITLAESPTIPDAYNYSITNFVEPTEIYLSDGSLVIEFDSIVDTTLINAQSLGWGETVKTWLNDRTVLVEGVAFGPNYLYIGDPMGAPEDIYNILFYLGDPEALEKPHLYAYEYHSSATAGCQGTAEVYTYFSEGPVTYTWSVPGSANAPTISNLCPGTYYVTVSDSSLDTMFLSFTIDELNLNAEASVTDANSGCNGTVQITAMNVDGTLHYDWSIPGAPDQASLSNLCQGNYTVMVTDNSDTTYVSFTIYDYTPALSAEVYYAPGSEDCMGTASVNVYNAIGPVTYVWDIPGAGNESYVDSLCEGEYSVTVTDSAGRSYFASFTIAPARAEMLLESLSSGEDEGGSAATSSQKTGGEQMDASATLISIYPNPSSDYLNVTISGNGPVTIEFFDNYGKLVKTGNSTRTSIADLATGVYMVRINGNNGKLHRFVKI